MKKLIITAITIVIVVSAIALFRGMFLMHKVNNQPSSYTPKYKYIENLNGLGCLKIGMTTSEVQKALDDMYLTYKDFLKKNYNSIDFVSIERNKMLNKLEPSSYKAPSAYIPNHTEYEVTLIFSENFAADRIQAYFWKDTLYRIYIPNYRPSTKEIGEGLIYKYGEGVGHSKKDGMYEDQLHRWGNEKCLVTYTGRTIKHSEGPRYFYNIEVITQNHSLTDEIETYLDKADSLWQTERDAKKYKGL